MVTSEYALDRAKEMLAERIEADASGIDGHEYEDLVERHSEQLRELVKLIPEHYNDAAVVRARRIYG